METKNCTRCKQVKPITDFNRRTERPHLYSSPGGYTSMCRECLAKYAKWRYKNNTSGYRDQQREWSRTSHQNRKAEVIAAYGGKCACCGETEPLFLTIDHINGDGAERRRQGEGFGGGLYYTLKRLGYPKDAYQLLCFNCNCSKHQFGVCPHTTRHVQAACAVSVS